MSIKVTIKQLLASNKPYVKFVNAETLPISTAYLLVPVTEEIDARLESYSEMRTKLIQRHGEKQPNGDYIVKEGTEEFALCESEVSAMEAVEVEFQIEPLTLDQVGKDTKLTVPEMIALKWLIPQPQQKEGSAI